MINQIISHYRIVEKLGGGGWVWFTRLRTRDCIASSRSSLPDELPETQRGLPAFHAKRKLRPR
jgi:hypothetical protein